jgi:AcrR family transcriptional regulator
MPPEVAVSRQTRRDLRRGQIITEARKLVAEEGLPALTIGALESRLDFTRGVITYHFHDKDDIIHAVLASAVEEINAGSRARLTVAATPEARVRSVIAGYVRGFLDHREAMRVLVSFWGRLGNDERAQRVNADLYAGYRRGAARLLEHPDFTPVDVEAMAAVMVGVVIGIAMQVYIDPAVDVDTAIDAAADAVLARVRKSG